MKVGSLNLSGARKAEKAQIDGFVAQISVLRGRIIRNTKLCTGKPVISCGFVPIIFFVIFREKL